MPIEVEGDLKPSDSSGSLGQFDSSKDGMMKLCL